MGRRSADEFPLLAVQGLYAADIRGNGNCLFNALSDQMYGDQDGQQRIRARVIEYMRDHAAYYKQFMDVSTGGGNRRNPKRKTTGAFSGPVSARLPSPEQVDAVFEAHLQRMAKGGTWGDNMEISAFSAAYAVDVKIYQRDLAYMVSGGEPGDGRQVVHIAYHVWEHYSSIRNLGGPHTGPPEVHPSTTMSNGEQAQHEAAAKTPFVADWMIGVVARSLPHISDPLTIRRALEAQRGDVDGAVSRLLDEAERSSASSATGSSSVEREPDSDYEAAAKLPSKKQDRRPSKSARAPAKGPRILADRLEEPTSVKGDEAADDADAEGPANAADTASFETSSSSSASSKATLGASSSSVSSLSGAPVPEPSAAWQALKEQAHPKRVSARDRKAAKKAAQKAAAKERKKAKARGGSEQRKPAKGKALVMKTGEARAPVVEQPFRTLYI
ncbi:MAG: hypothetical protein M1832_005321 [Thelocarpon impressellum]|nr:MAG: hypothetical protein M1832_005321 [Thelocarpon impressellum]